MGVLRAVEQNGRQPTPAVGKVVVAIGYADQGDVTMTSATSAATVAATEYDVLPIYEVELEERDVVLESAETTMTDA